MRIQGKVLQIHVPSALRLERAESMVSIQYQSMTLELRLRQASKQSRSHLKRIKKIAFSKKDKEAY